MSVRVDGEAEVPPHRWYQVLDALTRIDELLEVLVKQVDYANSLLRSILAALGGVAPPAPPVVVTPPAPAVATVQVALNNRYKVFTLDLSVPRSNVPLGILDLGVVVTDVTVTRMDSPAYWRRNDPVTGDLEELDVGYRVSGFEIRELYITNPPGAGYLTVVVEWRE